MEFAPNYQHDRPMSSPAFLPESRKIPIFLVLVSTTYSCFHMKKRVQSVINRLSFTGALFLLQIHQPVSTIKKTYGALYGWAPKVLDNSYMFFCLMTVTFFPSGFYEFIIPFAKLDKEILMCSPVLFSKRPATCFTARRLRRLPGSYMSLLLLL